MKTNLITIGGLPGSGKSTATRMIADELEKKGKQVVCMDGGVKEHPADYTDCDFPDFEMERAMMPEKWRLFVKGVGENIIYVFNCIFLQSPTCETIMCFGMEEATSETYVAEIAEIIKPMSPVTIYVGRPNVRAAVGNVPDERGNGWPKAVTDYHVSQGYGKQNHLSGYDGHTRCLEERRGRELNILRLLDIDSYTVSQDITTDESIALSASAGRSCPTREQMELAIKNSIKSSAVRHRGMPVTIVNWFGDYEMHWFMKGFIVHKDYQGQMIGTLLYRFSENFIEGAMKTDWKVCIDLRSSKRKENFYHKLGFQTMTEDENGSGMEKILE